MNLLNQSSSPSWSLILLSITIFVVSNNETFAQPTNHSDNNDIFKWHPPLDLQKKYAYFLSGYDKEGAPVWVCEYGKWNVRSIVEKGGSAVRDYDKYIKQLFERLAHPELFNKPDGRDQNGVVAIGDVEGLSARQVFHVPTMQQHMHTVRQFVTSLRGSKSHIKKSFLINCNIYYRLMWALAQPILGKDADKFELYGTNREEWEPAILKYIDKDQLPHWLGGSKEHKPIQVFG